MDTFCKKFIDQQSTKILLLLLVPFLYYLYSFGQFDIVPSDDDVYFQAGLLFKLPYEHFGNLLYPMGVYVFSKFFAEPILVSYSYTFFLSIGLFYTLFIFLQKYTNSFWIAFFIALAFLFSDFQVNLLPRITVLNVIFGLSFLSMIDFNRPAYANWGITAVGLLLCNYVSRPEFFWFFVLSSLIFGYQIFITKKLFINRKFIIGSSFIAFVGFFYFIGGGINEPGKLRVAFVQHFFDNYYVWYGKSFDYDEEFVVFDKIFGETHSDLDLITANPTFFFKHVLTNAKNYIFVVILILKSTFYDLFLIFFQAKTRYFSIIFVLFFGFLIDYKKTFVALLDNLRITIRISPFLIMFLLPTCVAILVVYPRHHYIIMHMPLYFLLIAMIFKSILFRKSKFSSYLPALFIFIYFVGLSYNYTFEKAAMRHTDYYIYMQELGKRRDIKLLSNDIFGQNYFPSHYTRVGWDPRKDKLDELLNSGKYDMLTLYGLDLEVPENREFLKNGYKNTQMVKIEIFEPIRRYIWVKPELAYLFKK